jgi:serine/threonine protein phosphatase 1
VTAKETAFVGDIHGNLGALNGIAELLINDPEIEHIVFLGDYINKGRESAKVIARLLEISAAGAATVLRGNHETAMLDALDTGELAAFLKKGGASTIRSYVGRPVRPDVVDDFRACVPDEHIRFLRGMRDAYETPDVVACHRPRTADDMRFRISAHIPVGMYPVIEQDAAYLDTNCGTPAGRLTAFRWPSRSFQQVDSAGSVVGIDVR